MPTLAASAKVQVGRGTKVRVAPANCALIPPPDVTFTATAGAAAAATSITVTSTAVGTWAANNPIDTNPYLQFVDPATGQEYLVKLNGNVASGATTLTVEPLKKAIPASAVAIFPTILSVRETANISTQDENAEVVTFDNDGWKDNIKTSLGWNTELNGPYLPTDAGYLNAQMSRLGFEDGETAKVYVIITLPKPGCENDTTYTKGASFRGFGLIEAMNIESSAKGIITGNISLTGCGKLTYELPS
ncbi:MAG: Phage tail tube protein [Actinomycetota bacterium]|jgi:hypothetical protein